ncbi:site-specific recombinase XerD [Rhodobacter sp. JA431]|nr:site-specific recombinase XerD [Rhodobacter sp. JA431]
MSEGSLSKPDNKKALKEDMRYLKQPRGPGTSWVFKMDTPPELIGLPNPWDGKPFRKAITRGLGTRRLTDARKLRDIALGDIRRLQDGLRDNDAFTLTSALEWREMVKAARQEAIEEGDPFNVGVEFILHDKLEDAAKRNAVPPEELKRFARVATGTGFPLDHAHAQYVEARREGNPYGYAPLKRTTVMNLDTAIKHLRAFLKDDAKTACLEDVSPEDARRFRDVYLPSVRGHRSPEGLSAKTIEKNTTLLKQLWVWAIESGHLDKDTANPWEFTRGLRRTKNRGEQKREDYQPSECAALLKATTRGSKEGDLIRLAIATGCRADEIATITIDQARKDGSGFYIAEGKTKNARRFIPVVGEAQALLQARIAAHGASGRVFPEWPIRPASGKAAAVSQWFTRFRRKVLGKETDDRLALHSTRHTWRTVARRAGVNEATINDLGGWAGARTSSSVYDHGLLEEQLVDAQRQVWERLKQDGYLEGF